VDSATEKFMGKKFEMSAGNSPFLSPGEKIDMEIVGIRFEEKIVSDWRFFSNEDVFHQKYDELPTPLKNDVDELAVEYWPNKGNNDPVEKPKVSDLLTIEFDTVGDRTVRNFGKYYNVEFLLTCGILESGKVGGNSKIATFCKEACGKSISDYALGEIFKLRDVFEVETQERVSKSGKSYAYLDVEHMIKKGLAPVIMLDATDLSNVQLKVLGKVKEAGNKDTVNKMRVEMAVDELGEFDDEYKEMRSIGYIVEMEDGTLDIRAEI